MATSAKTIERWIEQSGVPREKIVYNHGEAEAIDANTNTLRRASRRV